METSLELSRWRDKPEGIWYRRWVITSLGVSRLTRLKLFRFLLFLAWALALLLAATAFCFSQAIASGGWIETYAAHLGPRASAVVSGLGALILLYPDICVGGLFTLLFWLQAGVALVLCLVALTMIIPGLITRDRSSHAITIYLSRPLTTVDYLVGKLGIITSALVLLWTGPLLVSWLVAMLLSPSREFLVYSFLPLAHALLFNAVALLVLASISLGISAATKSSARTVLLWLGAWLILSVIANLPSTAGWLRNVSFTYDLDQVRRAIFQPGAVLARAAAELPMLNREVARNFQQVGGNLTPKDTAAAIGGLCVLVVCASFVFVRKIRSE